MAKVSIREFQKYAQRYLDQLPITLTRRGIPVATVIQYEESVIHSVIQPSSVPENVIHAPFPVNPVLQSRENIGRCDLHYWDKKDYSRMQITYVDESDTLIYDKKWLCPDCIVKLTNKKVGKITYEGGDKND
jgi:hypothetical protein